MTTLRDAWPLRSAWLSWGLFSLFLLLQLALLGASLRAFTSLRDSTPSAGGPAEQSDGNHVWQSSKLPSPRIDVDDEHPIRELMQKANLDFEGYNRTRSRTFKQTVERYRRQYGRHPPPDFEKWYKFARNRKVYHIDDFQQIHDDLRPFWAVSPADLRQYALEAGGPNRRFTASISVRNGQVFDRNCCQWRSEDFISLVRSVAPYLPNMDLPMNRMDQPRVIVPWDEMQAALRVEEATRSLDEDGVVNHFTPQLSGFWQSKSWYLISSWAARFVPALRDRGESNERKDDGPRYSWYSHADKAFMKMASKACPPESYARNVDSVQHSQLASSSYKHSSGGFVTNFNLSSDLCTAGPELSHLHGLLYASTSMWITPKVAPIFGECKTSINSDILIPATIYHKEADHYRYNDDGKDVDWDDKNDIMFWRGSTSGGTARQEMPERWHNMHRQRLVLATNKTNLESNTTAILALPTGDGKIYVPHNISLAPFAAKHTDVEFSNAIACLPNCSFYDDTFAMAEWTPFSEAYKHKYLIDVDGHSFSGRWRAYLQSRSLGLKATIMREWHDTRLWAWKHFVPVDNRYDDLYGLLAYFAGYSSDGVVGENAGISVPRHDYEAFKIATQSHDWAAKVLRKEDIEIYLYRLFLEYARLVDDNRDRIGYVGDGGREMEEFDRKHPAVD